MKAAIVVGIVGSLVFGASASARPIGVIVTGDPTLQTSVRAQLELWLRNHGHDPTGSALEPDGINALVDCLVMEDQACAQKVIEDKAKVDAVVYARVEAVMTGKNRDVTIAMQYFVKHANVAAERQVCEACNDEKMRVAGDAMIGNLVPPEAPKLPPAPEPPPPMKVVVMPPPAPSRMVPAIVIGTGVAALIGGGVFYLTSEVDDGSKFRYRDTKPLGIGLGVGGAVMIGAGIILMLRDGSPRDSGPTAAVSREGGVLGWAGSF